MFLRGNPKSLYGLDYVIFSYPSFDKMFQKDIDFHIVISDHKFDKYKRKCMVCMEAPVFNRSDCKASVAYFSFSCMYS